MKGNEPFKVGYAATGDPLGWMRSFSQNAEQVIRDLGCEVVKASAAISEAKDADTAVNGFLSENVDLILLQCNTLAGDGEIASIFIKSGIPLAVWCVPEPKRESLLYLNSMTCANLYMSVANYNLKELDAKVKWLYGAPDDPLFRTRLDITVRALRAVKRVRNAKIVQIGGRAFGFINIDYDRAAYEKKLGCAIDTLELEEIYRIANSMDGNAVESELSGFRNVRVSNTVKPSEMSKSARLILALRKVARENNYDAMAVSCWPGFQDEMGISSCMAYGQLNDEGHICACEGDVPGAISMMILEELSGRHPMIMDMVAMDQKEDAITFWHCGMGMPSYADGKGIEFIKYPSYPEILDLPGVSVDMKFAPQPATIARLGGWEADSMLIAESDIIEGPDRSYAGARGWFGNFRMAGKEIRALDFWNTVCLSGNAHHYGITSGHVGDACMEFAHRMGIRPIEKAEYHDYL